MRRLRWIAVVVLVLGASAGAMPTSAPASTSTVAPLSGDINTVYRFTGRGWQPFHRVFWQDYISETATTPFRTGSFIAGRFGTFLFSFFNPLTGNDFGRTHRMCFSQFDTRFRRTFRWCNSFFVKPPTIQVMPATTNAGQTSLLYATGFPKGRILDGQEVSPSGFVSNFTMNTRVFGAFLSGGPFGRIYVPPGGAALNLPSTVNAERGVYTLIVALRGGTLYARTAERVL